MKNKGRIVTLVGLLLLVAGIAVADGTVSWLTSAGVKSVSTTYPLPVANGASQATTLVVGSALCATSATQLPSHAGLHSFTVFVPTGGSAVTVGDATVSATAGDAGSKDLAAGDNATYDLPNTSLLYCRVAAGTQVLGFQGVK